MPRRTPYLRPWHSGQVVTLRTTRDAAQPFVTYYDGATGERTELSATSLRNWQSKTANYLRDGLAIDEGETVSLHLPPHWVVPIWVAATQLVGAQLRVAEVGEEQTVDLAVIGPDDVTNLPPANAYVACSLLPLAQPFADRLPVECEDYFDEVRQYGDFFSGSGAAAPNNPRADALKVANNWGLAQGDRFVVVAGSRLTSESLLALYEVPLAIDGSVVIIANSSAEQIADITTQERAKATVDV